MEEANINYHGLTGRDVVRMRGRPRITYNKKVKLILDIKVDKEDAEKVQRIAWLKEAAEDHKAMGNKLISVARRVKVNARREATTTKPS